ncbi:ABC transporter permease [Leptospira wolffii]|uniref:ABC transporter permease n=1 Tax=Leptospira wolffii TaxID=409998 RepID=A0ABV5BU92_9LEPT|nr:FtsX-like permease family protein [Leptospira wolffii]TGK54820.1 ABC transporter permease [Leptospira wolffii]TGK65353.1 ABC transporter permease [Leptospira wolffii]TGK70742.1 ABC transporter permease [Leptospira wolffii]TGL26449.1 ABC transporter permease [Leptospira wolffii]
MFFLAIRQLISRPQQTFLTFFGILLGTAGYVVFSGMMLGFQEYITDQLVNNDAQIRISPRDEILKEESFRGVFFSDSNVRWIKPPSGKTDSTQLTNVKGWFLKLDGDDRVEAYAPQLNRQLIFKFGKQTLPGKLFGIDPVRQTQVTTIGSYVEKGNLRDLDRGGDSIFVGAGLLERLGAEEGDILQVVSPSGSISNLKVTGVIRVGNRLIDESTVYASLRTVQRITQSNGMISEIVVRLKDVSKASEVATEWSYLTRDKVQSWDQAYESILAVFKTQNIVRDTTTFTIILVVAFGIYNVLNMVVNHKKKEIAILRSLGFDEQDTIRLFIIQGLLLGFTGALLGLLVGGLACYALDGYPIGGSNTKGPMMSSVMRISWDYTIYLYAFCLSVITSGIAAYIPARSASKLSPVEIIRGSN